MKKIIFILLCFWSVSTAGQFIHPGMLHTKADLDNIKARVQSGKEPWKTAWQQLQNSPQGDLATVRPHAISHVMRGPYGTPGNGDIDFYEDGCAVYTMALQWYITGNKQFAQKAIELLNAWSYRLDSITEDDQELVIGVAGIKYLNAAEIIKHTYKNWKQKDQKQFEKMILEVWYPTIINFKPRYNGNWDAAIGQTMMCIGIFTDRQDIFDRAHNQLLKGKSNGAINNYFSETGQCQESGRDQGHTQMGLGYLACACEIAWNQGVDLYSAYDNLLMKGYEYTSKFMLGEDVPYERYRAFDGNYVFGNQISERGRGNYSPIYERAYRHYHVRKGFDMPYTRRVIQKVRSEKTSPAFTPWGTLTCAETDNGHHLQVERYPGLPLLFQTGFEPSTRIVGNRLTGKDETLSEKNDWEADISKFAKSLSINFTGGEAHQRFAKIVPEPGNPSNHVMHFQLNEGWSHLSRAQFDLYGIKSGLKEWYQTIRIFLPDDLRTAGKFPQAINWLSILEIWNNVTWVQSVPYGFRVTLGIGKPTAAESDLYFILDAEDCELFENGRQRYTKVWVERNHEIKVPIGEWFTMHYYFKEGNAQTGRFIVKIETENEGERTVYNVTNFTHNTKDPSPDGVTEFNPLKWYTSVNLANFMKEQGKALPIYWDDFKLFGK